jgi:hypothetical protein
VSSNCCSSLQSWRGTRWGHRMWGRHRHCAAAPLPAAESVFARPCRVTPALAHACSRHLGLLLPRPSHSRARQPRFQRPPRALRSTPVHTANFRTPSRARSRHPLGAELLCPLRPLPCSTPTSRRAPNRLRRGFTCTVSFHVPPTSAHESAAPVPASASICSGSGPPTPACPAPAHRAMRRCRPSPATPARTPPGPASSRRSRLEPPAPARRASAPSCAPACLAPAWAQPAARLAPRLLAQRRTTWAPMRRAPPAAPRLGPPVARSRAPQHRPPLLS